MTWRFNNRTWELADETGRVVDSLTWDREAGGYCDSRGVLVGRRWEDAREVVERLARKVVAQHA